MTYLTGEEIKVIHLTIMEYYNDLKQAGIKYLYKFEAMLERPKTELFGQEQYPSIIEKACCYYHSIARGGHIFHNGNKRTSLVVLETFLDLNGYELTFSNKEAEDFTVYVAIDDKFKENDCIHYLVDAIKVYIIKKDSRL